MARGAHRRSARRARSSAARRSSRRRGASSRASGSRPHRTSAPRGMARAQRAVSSSSNTMRSATLSRSSFGASKSQNRVALVHAQRARRVAGAPAVPMTSATESATEPASTAVLPVGVKPRDVCDRVRPLSPPVLDLAFLSSAPTRDAHSPDARVSPSDAHSPTHTTVLREHQLERPRRVTGVHGVLHARASRCRVVRADRLERGPRAVPKVQGSVCVPARPRDCRRPRRVRRDVPAALRRGSRVQRGCRVHGRARREAARHRAPAQGENRVGQAQGVASRLHRVVARQGRKVVSKLASRAGCASSR